MITIKIEAKFSHCNAQTRQTMQIMNMFLINESFNIITYTHFIILTQQSHS